MRGSRCAASSPVLVLALDYDGVADGDCCAGVGDPGVCGVVPRYPLPPHRPPCAAPPGRARDGRLPAPAHGRGRARGVDALYLALRHARTPGAHSVIASDIEGRGAHTSDKSASDGLRRPLGVFDLVARRHTIELCTDVVYLLLNLYVHCRLPCGGWKAVFQLGIDANDLCRSVHCDLHKHRVDEHHDPKRRRQWLCRSANVRALACHAIRPGLSHDVGGLRNI